MIRRGRFVVGVFTVFSIVLGLVVRDVKAGDALKIGTVSFQQALNEVEQGKKAKAALKSEFDSKQKRLDVQQQELQKMQQDVEKNKGVLSQDALVAKQKIFMEKYTDLQKSMAGYREELMTKEAKMTGQILKNLKTVVEGIAKKEGFTLVMEDSQDAVLYVQSKEDLTNRVITLYNQKFTGPLKTE